MAAWDFKLLAASKSSIDELFQILIHILIFVNKTRLKDYSLIFKYHILYNYANFRSEKFKSGF